MLNKSERKFDALLQELQRMVGEDNTLYIGLLSLCIESLIIEGYCPEGISETLDRIVEDKVEELFFRKAQ